MSKANAISNESRMPSALKKHAPTKSKSHTQKNKKDVKKVTIAEPPKKQLNGKKHKELEDDGNEDERDADESGSEEDVEVDDDEGIDEAGLERLTKALGEDGLDDFDRAQLVSLRGALSEEEESHEAESGSEEEESVDEVEAESGNESAEEQEEAGEAEEQEQNAEESDGEDEDEDDDDDDDEGIALDDVESVDEDAVPRQKIEINNTVALERIRETIKLDAALPWTETLAMTYPKSIEVDVNDDLQRELAFYKQALHSANAARAEAAKHNFPFTRPADYFAEMIKSDAHMERIRQRLLDEGAGIKRSEEKRKEREGKKFGKQVQLEKLKEREKSKKDMDERLKVLKRKRKDMLDKPKGGDDFDVEVEDAIADRPAKRAKGQGGPKANRTTRNKKFGFGGPKKHSKQNTKASTDNFGPGAGKGKGRPKAGMNKRPGKSKRMAARSKR